MKKVLVYQDLLPHLPFFKARLKTYGFDLILIVSGADLISRLRDPEVMGAAIPLNMKQISWEELFLLKESRYSQQAWVVLDPGQKLINPPPGITLIAEAAELQKSMAEAFLKPLGEDMLAFVAGSEKGPVVAAKTSASESQERRSAPERVNIYSAAQIFGETDLDPHSASDCFVINMSLSGVLVSSADILPEGRYRLVWPEMNSEDGLLIDMVRSKQLNHAIAGGAHAYGFKFTDIDEDDTLFIERILDQNLRREGFALGETDLEFVREKVGLHWKRLAAEIITAEKRDRRYGNLDELNTFERDRIQSKQAHAGVILAAYTFRAKLYILKEILGTLVLRGPRDPEVKIILGEAAALQNQINQIELELERLIPDISEHEPDAKQRFIEVTNKLHQAKLQFYYVVDDIFKDEVWLEHYDQLAPIKEAVAKDKEMRGHVDQPVVFKRRTQKETKKDLPEVAHLDKGKGPKGKGLLVFSSVLAALLVLGKMIAFLLSFVSAGDLGYDFEHHSVKRDELGITVVMDRSVWDGFYDLEKEQIFEKGEKYLFEEKLRQLKFVTPDKKRIAATAVLRYQNDNKPVFGRREFKVHE